MLLVPCFLEMVRRRDTVAMHTVASGRQDLSAAGRSTVMPRGLLNTGIMKSYTSEELLLERRW